MGVKAIMSVAFRAEPSRRSYVRAPGIGIFIAFISICGPKTANADLVPNDPYYPQQWALSQMNVPTAWSYSMGSPDVKIGILDTGIMTETPDLHGRFLPPLVAATGIPDGSAVLPHGTWVASTIGMTINNGIGGSGSGNFSLLPIRITDATQATSDSLMIQGINLAAKNSCRVINLSFSATSYSSINKAVATALTANVIAGRPDFLVFMGAGNGNSYMTLGDTSLDNAQSRLPDDHLIMVGGTNQSDQRWATDTFTGSDVGPYLDLAAPAQGILVANGTDPALPYGYASGTSFAAPYAASAAALAFSINPNLTANQVQNILFDTAFNPDNPSPGTPYWDQTFGWGRVDFAGVATAASATLAPEPASLSLWAVGTLLLMRRRCRR